MLRQDHHDPVGALAGLLLLLIVSSWSAPARAQAPQLLVGSDALASVYEVPVLASTANGARVVGAGHYGFTEGVLLDGDRHHRLGASLAGSIQPHHAFAAAFRLTGRYDSHSARTSTDGGALLYSRLRVRTQQRVQGMLQVGGQLDLLVPPATAIAGAVQGLGVAADALIGLTSASYTLSARLGLRVDRGFASAERQGTLSLADRLALGMSQAPELRTGLSMIVMLRALALVAEWTWDPPLGRLAITPLEAPMWARAGVRVPLSPALALGAMAGFCLSQRPVLRPTGPLVRVEPRLWAQVTLAGVFVEAAAGTRGGAVPVRVTGYGDMPLEGAAVAAAGRNCMTGPDGACTLEHLPPGRAVVTVRARGYVPGVRPVEVLRPGARRRTALRFELQSEPIVLHGLVRAPDGTLLRGAHVSVMRGDHQKAGVTDAQGRFVVAGLPPGEVVVRIEAEGLATTEHTVTLRPGAGPLELAALPPVNVGQIQGTVRTLAGSPLVAKVLVGPGNLATYSDETGVFKVDVVPGTYTVQIEAPGFRSQMRVVRVEANSVAVLLLDLRKAPGAP